MADVFISYSRKNSDFVHKLDDALIAVKRDAWVDWQDIARGEDWWRSIQTGIDSADTALIIITENWLVSEICHRELEYIRKQNKRVFPIIREKIEGDVALRVKGMWVDQEWEQRARDNWKFLRSVNWLYFDDDTAFDAAVKDLLTALDTDQVYVKGHTRYLVRAMEWQQSNRNPSFLLDGDQVTTAQEWLKSSLNKTPEPLPVHHEYVTASSIAESVRTARDKARENLVRRSRKATFILGAVVVVAIIAAGIVTQQFLSARAEVTKASATLQQVNLQVTGAINQQGTAAAQVQAAVAQVATATVEQGNAVMAQQTSSAREAAASTQVAQARETLAPVPVTLTAVASAIADAYTQQQIALSLSDASVQLANNDPDIALASADGIVTDYPNEALAYIGRGLILDGVGRIDEAIADYTTALKLDPKNAVAYYNRGIDYGVQNKPDEAIADYTQSIQFDPTFLASYFNRGNQYYVKNQLDQAIADFSYVIEHSSIDDAYNHRGATYARQGQYQLALADYWQWVQNSRTMTTTLGEVRPGSTPFRTTLTISKGTVYEVPFGGKAGQALHAEASAVEEGTVDPLLVVLDPQGQPIYFNDDLSEDNNQAFVDGAVLPANGIYTLIVAYSGGGTDGDLRLTLDLTASATATPTS